MNGRPQSEITQILVRLQADGVDPRAAADRIFELAHAELRQLATGLMRRERDDHTFQPTILVHEAYLRMADASAISWEGRAHFFGIAARAMRQILIQHARRRATAKRGGDWERVTLRHVLDPGLIPDVKLLRLEELLNQLAEMDDRMARVVELRVFAGMTIPEIAHVLDVSPRTVDNEWSLARAWLSRELAGGSPS